MVNPIRGLFEITKITDKNGVDRTDGRYPLRLKRRCRLYILGCDAPLLAEYAPRDDENYGGTLRTSLVEQLEAFQGVWKITTLNSVYYFKEL